MENGRTVRRVYVHEYNCWKAMRNRCSNPKNASWKYYGGRGIRVCERWQTSFVLFLSDVGPAPSSKHQLGRKRTEDNYEPGNVEWETAEQQQQNTSKVVYIEYAGLRLSRQEWAKRLGITPSSLCKRLERKWSLKEALELQQGCRRKIVENL